MHSSDREGRPLDPETARVIATELQRAAASRRGHADFFHWPDKPIKELAVAQQFLTSLMPPDERTKWTLSRGGDPPDCVVTHECGTIIGLEVTELVCEECIHLTKREQRRGTMRGPSDGFTRYWDTETLERVLREGLARKDVPTRVGSFSEYWVVFHTDESLLDIGTLQQSLAGSVFGPYALIDRAFTLCSYDPRLRGEHCGGYPTHELPLSWQE